MNQAVANIKAKALELGFTKVGIAKAEELTEEASRLREWLHRGYHATMEWMARNVEKRIDPRLVVPNAKSVICVALNYFTPYRHADEPGTGKISRYAWGDDYHDLVLEKLARLWDWMKAEFPDEDGRYYVDTGPMMEKVWAQRAGIGWIGKHTNLITQDVGSWIFLGELITTLDLPSDLPATDHCGTCTLCIEACPTDAITQPYVVDSHRCISYLTIEHRGAIDEQLSAKFDQWIYGCDICQEVCPWNHKFATMSHERAFEPRDGNLHPRLEEWKEMSLEEFRLKFRGSPIKRTKITGLKRNIEAVLKASQPTLTPAAG
ncbi:MAG: tRNA epoxyqueuosine(34) reductase QueG [Ignavibacteria bacterium]